MKKILFTLILSLLTLTMSAQIQRKFLGNTLAVSTITQVKANMAKKGYKATANKDYIVYSNVTFAGLECEKAIFFFHNNKFCMISFILNESYNKDQFKGQFESISNSLFEKYSPYNSVNQDDSVAFEDNATFVSLSPSNNNKKGIYIFSLAYFDKKLMIEKEETINKDF